MHLLTIHSITEPLEVIFWSILWSIFDIFWNYNIALLALRYIWSIVQHSFDIDPALHVKISVDQWIKESYSSIKHVKSLEQYVP